jgi:hypothetical protein
MEMTNSNRDQQGLGRFSNDEVKALLMAIGLGVVLGVAVEMLDNILPNEHKMSAIVKSLFKERQVRKQTKKSSYDLERPSLGFNVTD